MQDEWISTRDAAELLGCSYDKARDDLKALGAARREITDYGRKTEWRRVDVLAAKELRAETNRASVKATRTKHTKPKPTTTTGIRACLCCSRPFRSEGIHNRLCDSCRTGDAVEYTLPKRRR